MGLHLYHRNADSDHPKGWGKEIWIVNNHKYCGKLLKIKKNHKFSMHYHLNKEETFYVLKGQCLLNFYNLTNAEKKSITLKPGQVADIPRGFPHQIVALTNCVLIEISTTHEEDDSYRIDKGDSQTKQLNENH